MVIDRDQGTCISCGSRFDEVHHRYRRGMGGSSDPEIHSPTNLVCLCSGCHREAESLRLTVAEPLGLCVPSLAEAYLTPVLVRWLGWAIPLDRGTWMPVCPPWLAIDSTEARRQAYLRGALPLTS